MKKLPIGIQSLRSLITEGHAYADKTEPIYQLIQQGTAYFLSRPRRFGKSLLPARVYVFEFKIDLSVQDSLAQIKQRDYAKRFEGQGREIALVGANFSSKTRDVDDWVQESIPAGFTKISPSQLLALESAEQAPL